MQNIRIYFDRKDNDGNIITCFYDATKTDSGEIELGDWGELIDRAVQKIGNETIYSGGRKSQPAFLLDIIMEKLPKTTFERHPYSGNLPKECFIGQTKTENK